MEKIITSKGVLDIHIPASATTTSTGEYYMACPICSSHRKPEHQNEKIFAVNLHKIPRVWRCNHCGEGGHVIDEAYMARVTIKPIIENKAFNPVTDILAGWFLNERAISKQTLLDLDVTSSMESIKQTKKVEGEEDLYDQWILKRCINFKYKKDGILINVKYRDKNKNFKMITGATKILYNIDSLKDQNKAVITEGECFTGATEVLTKNGWLRFDAYNGEDIMQASNNYPIIGEFVKPNAIIIKDYSGSLVELKSKNYYSLTTPDHNIITQTFNTKENQKRKAINVYSIKAINGAIPITLEANENIHGLELSDDEIRFCVSVSADMTIRKEGDIYGCFRKERKKKRMTEMLKRLGIRYSINIDNRGWYSIFIHRKQGLNYVFKYFPIDWIGKLNNHQIGVILEELLFWDGNSVPNRTQIEYGTIWYENAIFIQTLCHMKGMASTIIRRKNKFGSWYKISILKKNHVSLQKCLQRKLINYNGKVYCVNVPSGAMLIRHNEKISISGNCDVLAFHEAGVKAVVSVPNGTTITQAEIDEYQKTNKFRENLNMEYLDLCIEDFAKITTIYLATDDDMPGQKLREELSRRLGKNRCRFIRFSEYKKADGTPCKDANDVLKYHGKTVLLNTLGNSYPYPMEGVTTAKDYMERMEKIFDNGRQKGFSTGYRSLDPHFNWMYGWLHLANGYAGEGKSSFLFNLLTITTVLYGWKWGMYCPENYPPENIIDTLIEILVGDTADIKWKDRMSKDRYMNALDHIQKHFFFVDNEKGYSPQKLREIKKNLITQHGINGFLTDPWKNLYHDHNNDGVDIYLARELAAEVRLAVHNDLINIISHHPPTPPRDKDKNYAAPSYFELVGGQIWSASSYAMLCIHKHDRVTWQNTTAEIHVQKIKDQKLAGIPTDRNNPVLLKFDRRSGRFYEREDVLDLDSSYTVYPFRDYIGNSQAVFDGF